MNVVSIDAHLVNREDVCPKHDVQRGVDTVLEHMGQHVLGHRRVDGIAVRPADEVVVRPLARVRWRGQHGPPLVHLLVAAEVADAVEHRVMRVRLHHDRVMFQYH